MCTVVMSTQRDFIACATRPFQLCPAMQVLLCQDPFTLVPIRVPHQNFQGEENHGLQGMYYDGRPKKSTQCSNGQTN